MQKIRRDYRARQEGRKTIHHRDIKNAANWMVEIAANRRLITISGSGRTIGATLNAMANAMSEALGGRDPRW